MRRRVVLAAPDPQYAAKLARFLKENEPEWEVAAFTQEASLARHLKDAQRADALVVQSSMLERAREEAERAGWRGKGIVLADRPGEREPAPGWAEVAQYQALSRVVAELRSLVCEGGGREAGDARGTPVWTVFSASGGAGKTAVSLNLVRQACERGYRTLYLNLELLNATELLFGTGEPDSLSRLLYALQAGPERVRDEWERLRRRHPWLQADYLDAPDDPSERLAMTTERLKQLLSALTSLGTYDLIVADPDSGASDWHLELLAGSDRVVWLTVDDALCLRKAEKLCRHWQDELFARPGKVSFVRNKASGSSANRWSLPGAAPDGELPYIPQWKAIDQPSRLLQAPAFCGAVDRLLDGWGLVPSGRTAAETGT
ncbi:hypothetical protein [Cohnella zeiphila]|uniref:CobQ/CobB/MinD/ParA nucleotide binding domain-containing protein n=1 Tax=Cohnella zeiphila TaxID=2761120 RepID=A0A7X0SLM1_9BACL|nr:hypothetical protein [Cohnella zeiphila]MBB6730965.1 hypothetical protein [Cohnella zeiphila]